MYLHSDVWPLSRLHLLHTPCQGQNQIQNLYLHFEVWPLSRLHLLHTPCQGQNRPPEHKTNHDTGRPCRLCCVHWALLPPPEEQPGHDDNHSPPSIAKCNNAWSCISTHLYAFVAKASNAFPLLILFIFSVSYLIILNDTFMFNPIYRVAQKNLYTLYSSISLE